MDRHAVGRWNPVEEEWTIQVPGREGVMAQADLGDARHSTQSCPFCPGSVEAPQHYETLLMPSRFPVVRRDADADQHMAYGLHDVFLYTSDHLGRLVDQPVSRLAVLLRQIAECTDSMLADPLVQAVFGFEARGDHFGPTVAHPHGQLIAFPFVPRRLTVSEADCRFCPPPRGEAEELLVHRGSLTSVAVPPSARLPFEMVLVPDRHVPTLSGLNFAEVDDLATSLSAALRACLSDDGVMPQYLLTIMQAPKGHQSRHHLRIELLPLHRPHGGIKRSGGVEVGAGVYLNLLLPRKAARMLRERLS
ncbi:hypothetical protein OOK41_17135 [Micromonospora sp. NBC_01655]|uniref:hypothetical protein n=1 Tax=Micromonospora sp. NBC_01655 TaxID=2975983 RepID=UPI0022582ADE|nr:hypothetical protein [Micromonospora sp. NBC_01655]MCX4472011.1 hypothetical protein [Micromonospora sp. NBC_01655]